MHIPYTERIYIKYEQKRDSCSSKLVHFKKKCFLIFRKKTRNKRIKQISFLENEKQNQKTRNKDIIKQTTNKVIMRVSFVQLTLTVYINAYAQTKQTNAYLVSIGKATPKEVWPWPTNCILCCFGENSSYQNREENTCVVIHILEVQPQIKLKQKF